MTFYYRPTVTEAFASVQYIMTEANFGWLIRSVHRWSASMMVLMMILHVFWVYLTRLTTYFGVTSYSLLWDQIRYRAVKIVTVELLRVNARVGQSTLTRFYCLHTFLLRLLIAIFMLMHFAMIRKQGIFGPL
ncbi:putative plastoquinol--plastocyanin reductase [Lupinus albus]|uniref:Putative plastoquinol--plastocyanin reductase n=1 Tax=Lupinus albus TaxID=3870 RepID=A0A6A4NFU6_LUPAL|nr:putative plastoquinol--plastocyanin reductase [Lupinus albus]